MQDLLQGGVRSSLFLAAWRRFPKPVRDLLMYAGSPKSVVNVQGALLMPDERLVLVRHSYGGARSLILPGGLLVRGEQPEEGLAREVREELGVAVRPERLLLAQRHSWLLTLTYLAYVDGTVRSSPELSEVRLVTLADALALQQRGEASIPAAVIDLLQDRSHQQAGVDAMHAAYSNKP